MTIVLNFVIGQPSNARPVSQTTTTTPLTTTLRTTPGKTTAAANPQSCKSDQNSPPRFQSITADITDNFPSLEHNFKRIAVKIIMLLQSIHYQSNVYTFLLCISLSVCTSWFFVLSSSCMYICNLNFQFSNSYHISGQQQITSDSHCTCLADAKVLYVR